jgi:hypothetical protein
MTTAKWTINTGVQQDFGLSCCKELMKRVVLQVWGWRCSKSSYFSLQDQDTRDLLFLLISTLLSFLAQDLTKDNNPHTFWGIQASLLQ